MGNCQAADAAGIVIYHPNGRPEILSTSAVTASHLMASNPGYYVALIIVVSSHSTGGSSRRKNSGNAPVRYLKLLSPDDTLLVRKVYWLVSFEDVVREFGSKKRVRLSRLLAKQKKEQTEGGGGCGSEDSNSEINTLSEMMKEEQRQVEQVRDVTSTGAMRSSTKQWRPTLQTIVEIAS